MKNIFFRRSLNNYQIFNSYNQMQLELSQKEESIKKHNVKINKLKKQINIELNNYIYSLNHESKEKSRLLHFSRNFYNNKSNIEFQFKKIKELFPIKILNLFHDLFLEIDNFDHTQNQLNNLYDSVYYAEKNFMIRSILSNNNAYEGLEMINKNIKYKLKKLEHKDSSLHNKKERKMDSFIYKYFTRICLKPSPFGLVASTGSYGLSEKNQHYKYMRLNNTINLNAIDYIKNNHLVILESNIIINQTIIEKDNKIYFTIFDNKEDNTLYKNRQNLVTIKKNQLIEKIILIFKNNTEIQGSKLIYLLSMKNPTDIIFKLLDIGFLILKPIFNSKDDNRTIDYIIEYTNKFPELFSEDIKNRFREIKYLECKNYTVKRYNTLKLHANVICNELGITNIAEKNLVYIDTIDNRKKSQTDTSIELIEKYKSDWELLSDFIGIFDINFRNKYLARKYLDTKHRGHFIPNTPKEISRFLREIAEILFIKDEYWLESFGYISGDYKNSIDKLIFNVKETILCEMVNQMNNKEEIVFTEDFINKITGMKKKLFGKTHNSRAFFIQRDKDVFVVNHIYKGYGVYNRRFKEYYSNHINDCESLYQLNGRLVDIPVTFGFNANIRLYTNQVLKLPIGENNVIYSNEIDWLSLGFKNEKDKKEITIFNNQSNEVIYPHFLGSLITTALPSLVAIFNAITLNDSIYFNMSDLLIRRYLKSKNNFEIKKFPRVYFKNKNIILSRARYYIDVPCLEINHKMNNIDFWQQIKTIFNKFQLPIEFYIVDFFVDYTVDSELKKNKPQYININSPMSVKEFRKLILDKNFIIIEEVFPRNEGASLTESIEEYIYETKD